MRQNFRYRRRAVFGSLNPRGSILVFAVVLLSILAMLGTAYLIVMQQSSKVSSNAASTLQSDQSSRAGLEHAVHMVRRAVAQYSIIGVNGIGECVTFDPAATSFYQFP